MKSDKEVFPSVRPRVNFQALLMLFVVVIKRFKHNQIFADVGKTLSKCF